MSTHSSNDSSSSNGGGSSSNSSNSTRSMNVISFRWESWVEIGGDRRGARAEHIKLTTHFPEKIIIRYPVFVRVFTFFLKTNFIIERFVESSPNPTRTYFGLYRTRKFIS